MQSFLDYVLFNEGVNPQLATAQLSKKWRQMDRIPEDEIAARVGNASTTPQMNIDAIVKMLADADPTSNKEYFPWILTQYVTEKVRLPEDSPILHQDLNFYTTIKKNGVLKRLTPQIKQQMSMGTDNKQNPMDLTTLDRSTLQKMVDKVQELTDGDLSSKRKQTAIVKQDGAKSIYKDSEWEIVEVVKGKAACYYAKGTRWCTSNERTADHYLNDGPLYIIYQEGKPYAQAHFPSQQFMDPQDDDVKDLPDDIAQAMIEFIPDLSDDDKTFIYKHCERGGEMYQNYISGIEKKFNKMLDDRKFRDELSASVNFDDYSGRDDDYVMMDASLSFHFPAEDFIKPLKDIRNDRPLLRTIRDTVEVHTDDAPEVDSWRDGQISFTFRITADDLDLHEEQRWKRFLDTLASGYNDDDDYFNIKHQIYLVLEQNGVMKSKISDETHEELTDEDLVRKKFKWLQFDDQDYHRQGSLEFHTKEAVLCSFKETHLDIDKFKSAAKYGSRTHSLKGNDFSSVAEAFEKFLRGKAMSQVRRHKAQGWLPFPGVDKPHLPPDFVSVRRAPKVKVDVWLDAPYQKTDYDVKIRVKLEAHLHKNDEREIKEMLIKVEQLDKHFPEALEDAKAAFMKLAPDLKPPTS